MRITALKDGLLTATFVIYEWHWIIFIKHSHTESIKTIFRQKGIISNAFPLTLKQNVRLCVSTRIVKMALIIHGFGASAAMCVASKRVFARTDIKSKWGYLVSLASPTAVDMIDVAWRHFTVHSWIKKSFVFPLLTIPFRRSILTVPTRDVPCPPTREKSMLIEFVIRDKTNPFANSVWVDFFRWGYWKLRAD